MASSGIATAPIETLKDAVNTAVETITGAVKGSPKETKAEEGLKDEAPVLSPKSEQTKKLERQLSLRPDKSELVEKNILKSSSVAPSLQAAQADLERAQLENKLEGKLQARPKPEELVKEGILQADEVPGA